MKRVLRVIGGILGVLLLVLAALGWYVSGLPWRNSCETAARAPSSEESNAAVATSQPVATRAAAAMLEAGGSAIDAAIAAALTLAVAEPGNSGLGGGGFALVYDPREARVRAFDFREQAPMALDLAKLTAAVKQQPNALRDGALAVAVPSEWQGLLELHRRYGKLPLATVAAPAIAAAQNGVEVTAEYCARCWVRSSVLKQSPEAKRIFMTSLGVCPLPGWTLRQPELAETLTQLTSGVTPKSFDEVVGTKMVALVQGGGSSMTEADLARPRVVERTPVEGTFKGRRLVSMPLPSSGGLLVIQILQTYEQARARLPAANPQRLFVEASRLAFFDRARAFGDPDFVKVDSTVRVERVRG